MRCGFLLVAAWAAAPLAAQQVTRASGTVLRPTSARVAGEPVVGARVVLHRVGRATQGPIDTAVTDDRGRFAFRFSVDTAANFLLSARHEGIEYFSQPLATNPARPDTAIVLSVHDTSTAVPIATRSRTFVVGAPDAIGARTIVDWVVLANDDRRTRVGADSSAPTWAAAIPESARNAHVGDARLSQISPDAVVFRGDSVLVLAPLSPGEKELLVQYELPAGSRRIRLTLGRVDSVEIFLEEPGASLGAGWRSRDSQRFEGRSFRRFERVGTEIDRLEIVFPGQFAAAAVLPYLVAGTALLLLLTTWWMTRKRVEEVAVPAVHRVALANRIARLDREIAALPADGRGALEAERAALLDRLRGALAGGNDAA